MNTTKDSSTAPTFPVHVIAAVVIWAVISIFVGINGDKWFLPVAASSEAGRVDMLFRVLLGSATFIFLLVETALFYFVIRYGLMRDRSDDSEGPPIHGNTRLEIIWTVIPVFIVTALTIYNLDVFLDITGAKENEHVIDVSAQQFFWQFHYPDDEYDLTSNHVLVVPRGRTVRLEMDSSDVIHAFWVPAFRVKQDVMPGRTTEVRFTPTEVTGLPPDFDLVTVDDLELPDLEGECPAEGALPPAPAADEAPAPEAEGDVPPVNYETGYDVVCAELCGPNHGLMRGAVFVVEQEEYDAYIESLRARLIAQEVQQQFAIKCGGEAVKEAGRAIFEENGCDTCHQLADAGSMTATLGPSLNAVVQDAEDFGFEDARVYIRTSIVNPNAFIVPGYPEGLMPQNFAERLTAEELDLLVEYLSLQTGE